MSLTGTGIRIGTATEFGQGIRFPRALASDGTQVILFDSSKGYLLDVTTGSATPIGTIDQFGRSEQQCRAATYHNNQFVFFGNSRKTLYVYDPSDGSTSDLHGNPLTIQGTTDNPDIWGLTSLNGTLYALDRSSDKLYTVDLSQNIIIPVGDATDYGLAGSPNIQGFAAYGGELIGVSTGLDQLVRFNQTTGVATAISTLLLPDASSEALVEHAGQLLMAGSGADALFRLYDVLWNETIADLEVDEGDSATWSLSDISQDAASFALQSTPPSWLSVSGTNLVATTAPDVNTDQNHDVQVRATRDGINVDETLRVVVAAALVLPTWQASIPAISVNEGNNHTTDTEPYLTDATGLEFAPSHTARSWLSVSGFDLVITGAPDVTADTDYDVVLRATNSDGHRDKTLTVRVIAEAAPPPPLNPPTFMAPAANYEVNERADDSIDATAFFTGHTSLAFQTGYSAPSWLTISGLNVVITGAPDVLEDTDFTVPLTGTNNDGSVNGSITISVQQIDPAPVFGTPNRFDIDEGSFIRI